MVGLVPDKADSLVTKKGRLGRIRSLVVLASFSNVAKRASIGSATPGARSGNLRSIVGNVPLILLRATATPFGGGCLTLKLVQSPV